MEVGVNVDIISDLHVDTYIKVDYNHLKWERKTRDHTRCYLKEKPSELLIVVGDIANNNYQAHWVIDELSKQYVHIIYVLGNHEFYMDSVRMQKKFGKKSLNKVQDLIDRLDYLGNVTICTDVTDIYYKGKRILAGTLWYPLNTQEQRKYYKTVSNDSEYIKFFAVEEENEKAIGVLKRTKCIDLVVTHMPPYTTESIIEKKEIACYSGEVNLAEVDTKNWVYGHTHENRAYTIVTERGNKIKMFTNTVGYKSEGRKVKIQTITI